MSEWCLTCCKLFLNIVPEQCHQFLERFHCQFGWMSFDLIVRQHINTIHAIGAGNPERIFPKKPDKQTRQFCVTMSEVYIIYSTWKRYRRLSWIPAACDNRIATWIYLTDLLLEYWPLRVHVFQTEPIGSYLLLRKKNGKSLIWGCSSVRNTCV